MFARWLMSPEWTTITIVLRLLPKKSPKIARAVCMTSVCYCCIFVCVLCGTCHSSSTMFLTRAVLSAHYSWASMLLLLKDTVIPCTTRMHIARWSQFGIVLGCWGTWHIHVTRYCVMILFLGNKYRLFFFSRCIQRFYDMLWLARALCLNVPSLNHRLLAGQASQTMCTLEMRTECVTVCDCASLALCSIFGTNTMKTHSHTQPNCQYARSMTMASLSDWVTIRNDKKNDSARVFRIATFRLAMILANSQLPCLLNGNFFSNLNQYMPCSMALCIRFAIGAISLLKLLWCPTAAGKLKWNLKRSFRLVFFDWWAARRFRDALVYTLLPFTIDRKNWRLERKKHKWLELRMPVAWLDDLNESSRRKKYNMHYVIEPS